MDFLVTPYEVKGKVDYDRLMEEFGISELTVELASKLEKKCGKTHFLSRRIFYSHRDLDKVLSAWEEGKEFYLYTGRGPSGPVHLGHLMPWIFTKYLQECFEVKLIFQMTDDEKFLYSEGMNLEEAKKWAYENSLDVIALGFDPKRTEIIMDTEHISLLYEIAIKVAKKINFSLVKAVFGFNSSTNVGLIFFTSLQAAPAFLESERRSEKIPCLIPCAIDQDPHFRIARDVAPKLGYPKPSLILSKFFPSLSGANKMSSSSPEGSIYVTDSEEEVTRKIRNAFTGGQATIKEQREKGGNPEICSVFQYYFYLFEEDDSKLMERMKSCKSGELLCGDCKSELIERVLSFLRDHREKREKARDLMQEFVPEEFRD